MQDTDFKSNLNRILNEKANMHIISNDKIIYTNGAGILPYEGKGWYAVIYYYCSKIAYEKTLDETLNVIFYAGGKHITIKKIFYVKDLTNLLFQLRKRFLDEAHTYTHIKENINDLDRFYISFIFKNS